LLRTSITYLLEEEPMFALVRKTIFDGVSNNYTTITKTFHSFTKKSAQKPVAIHLEVYEE